MSIPIFPSRKVAIIGFTVSREDAPWGDPSWELLGMNNLHRFLKPEQKPTGWFDLHAPDVVVSDPEHVEWLKTSPVPKWMWPRCIQPDYRNVTPYPRDTLDVLYRDFLNCFGWRYYTNTISYAVSLVLASFLPGLLRGEPAELALYGIDLAMDSEWAFERPSAEYWLGLADGYGTRIHIAERADLLKCGFRYGDEEGEFAAKMRAREGELVQMVNAAAAESEALRSQLEMKRMYEQHLRGAYENQHYVNSRWTPPEAKAPRQEDDPSVTAA